MKKVSFKFYLIVYCLLIFSSQFTLAQKDAKRPLDIVFCVDLSGSTNGLINNVRDNLWLIINQANNMVPAPDLRIAVVGYSRPSFGKSTGYVRILSDLTHNFDHVAAELYKLKPSIEKGDQYVSAALSTCVSQLSWSKNQQAFKTIFLCGNGMVTSNGYDYIKYCEQAAAKNIIVNTLYIPNGANIMRELPAWRRISTITSGMQSEMTVANRDNVIVFTDVNLDRIKAANNKLNSSYLWVGPESESCRKALVTADSGAFYSMKDAFFNRAYFKCTEEYELVLKDCDLVNAYTIGSATTPNDSSYLASEAPVKFANHFIEMKESRTKLIANLKQELPDSLITNYKQLFSQGLMPEKNIFTRVILTVLFKQWERR